MHYATIAASIPKRRIVDVMRALVLILSVCAAAAHDALPVRDNGVYPLSGTDPRLPVEEWSSFLDAIVADAPIVAIGESLHGNRGFMQMEHRLVRYLVERKGFRTIVLENALLRSEPLAEWVRECLTDRSLPVGALAMPYRETVDLFFWMCEFNRAHPQDPIHFQGMDIWDRPWEHQARIEQLSKRLSLSFERHTQTMRKHCWMHSASDWEPMATYNAILQKEHRIPVGDFRPCTDALEFLRVETLRLLRNAPDSQRNDLYALLRSLQTALGWQMSNNVDFAHATVSDRADAFNARDLAQARNAFAVWEEFGRAKMVILTHTIHAAKMAGPARWLNMPAGAFRSGLARLQEMIGSVPIKAIMLTGYDVAGSARGAPLARPTSTPSLELALHRDGYRVAFVNPRGGYCQVNDMWGVQDQSSPGQMLLIKLPEHFDAYVFVNSSPEGQRNEPWRDIWHW